MSLQWYPGHMAKAVREMKEVLPTVDLLIEILDARIPFSSRNPVIEGLGTDSDQEKPRIKIMTRDDLADSEITQLWLDSFNQQGNVHALSINNQDGEKVRKLIPIIKKVLNDKLSDNKKVRVLIAGIPNVGKSTFINNLVERSVAKTGNEPAITKGQQRIKLDDQITLLDTPGVFWPKVENQHSAYRQGVTGAIKEAIIDNQDVAFYACEYCLQKYPQAIKDRYHLDSLPQSPEQFFEQMGEKRGSLKSGGRVDFDKVCTLFINELREGLIGKISLETPEMIEKELVEVEKILAEKEARKKEKALKKAEQKKRTRKNRR